MAATADRHSPGDGAGAYEIILKVSHTIANQQLGGSLPFMFTKYGILQVAYDLRSGRATQVSIKIFDVFVKMREMLMDTISRNPTE